MRKYWNLISTLFKRSNHSYFTKFFQEHITDFINAWKVIKSFISIKTSNQTYPNAIFYSNTTLTHPATIVNAFNEYISSIALDIQSLTSSQQQNSD